MYWFVKSNALSLSLSPSPPPSSPLQKKINNELQFSCGVLDMSFYTDYGLTDQLYKVVIAVLYTERPKIK